MFLREFEWCREVLYWSIRTRLHQLIYKNLPGTNPIFKGAMAVGLVENWRN
jgi:hypothetical protein